MPGRRAPYGTHSDNRAQLFDERQRERHGRKNRLVCRMGSDRYKIPAAVPIAIIYPRRGDFEKSSPIAGGRAVALSRLKTFFARYGKFRRGLSAYCRYADGRVSKTSGQRGAVFADLFIFGHRR